MRGRSPVDLGSLGRRDKFALQAATLLYSGPRITVVTDTFWSLGAETSGSRGPIDLAHDLLLGPVKVEALKRDACPQPLGLGKDLGDRSARAVTQPLAQPVGEGLIVEEKL